VSDAALWWFAAVATLLTACLLTATLVQRNRSEPVGCRHRDNLVCVFYAHWMGQSTMCRDCWDASSVEERVAAHRQLCTQWRRSAKRGVPHRDPDIDTITRRVEQAIRADDVAMWAAPEIKGLTDGR
jgi:hypothetical protein